MERDEESAIEVGNAHLLHDGLYIGFTKIEVADWDDFGLVVKYCKKYIIKALDKAFSQDMGELHEVSAGQLALRKGRSPSEQFKAIAQSFQGDPVQTRILIGWCVLLNLEIRLNPELRRVGQAALATNFIAYHAWKSAFTVPIPQVMRGRLVDVPADVQKREQDLYQARRFDKAQQVAIPSTGSSKHFTAFGISVRTGGDIIVTPGRVLVGLFCTHFLQSKAKMSKWLTNERMDDFATTVEEYPDSYRYRVHQQPGYTCLRFQCKIQDAEGKVIPTLV